MLLKANRLIQTYRAEVIITLIFLVIYCLVSLVNHYNLRTNALDLGMFNHALYSFSHAKLNYFTLDLSGNNPNYFADHFSPLTVLYSPLYYIFGSWTLLLVQIASVIFGAFGCYRIARYKLPEFKASFLILLFFLAQWAIISALAFDFHNNVVAAMFVPWFIYYRLTNKKRLSLLFFFLILIAKENMALWMFFILAGMMLTSGIRNFFGNIRDYLKFEIPLMLFSLIYFYVIVSLVMPALSEGEAVNQIARFGSLGSSLPEILVNVIKHPIDTFKLLFWSQLDDPLSYGIKKELHLVVFFSGGFALILRPAYLLMLVPIYAQKLFADNMALWGINGQYSIEFTPIITLALIDLLVILKTNRSRMILLFTGCSLALAVNFITLQSRVSFWYDSVTHHIFRKEHYDPAGLNVKYVHKKIAEIPDEIPISVTSCLAPHLANRDRLYHFPTVQDSEMIVLIKSTRSTYPIPMEEQQKIVDDLLKKGEFSVLSDKNDLLILKRNKTH